MHMDHARNITQDAAEDLAISTSHAVFFFARGWCAAERGEPRDPTQGSVWCEGFDLYTAKHGGKRVLQ